MTTRRASKRFLPWVAIATVLAALVCGCAYNGPPYVTAARLDDGLVLILPGIEGPSVANENIRRGLFDAKLPYALEIYDWRAGRLGSDYAFDRAASRKRAREIAARIADYRADRPRRPVFLVGHSGGGAIAVFAAEAIPSEAQIDGVVLLAAALSPHYNLGPALDGCRRRMLNCFSESDVTIRTGTTLGRNFDGVSGPTAGQQGFSLPPGAPQTRQELFAYLRQIRWDQSMVRQGNLGGHFGWTSPAWVQADLAPILLEWAGEPPASTSP